jgi:hypothetical protein
VHKNFGEFVKVLVLLLVTLSFGVAFAQENPDNGSQSQIPGNTAPPLLARPYEAAKDFFNFFAFASGVSDSNGAYLENANAGATFGEMIGGGAAGFHQFATGSLSIYYNGDYRHYNSNGYGDGTDQTLSIFYQKIFKRWTFTAGEVAGEFFQGGTAYSANPNPENPSVLVQTSPISTKTEYAGTTLSATYQQSLRLSYLISASYFLERYNGIESIGSNNLIGTFSTIYRLTRRTSLSGNYSHSNFLYQNNGGNSNVDSVFLTLGHDFASHWSVSASGGASRASSSGTFQIPVFINGFQNPVLVTGKYNQTTTSPYFQGTATRFMRHSSVSLSGGQSVGPGNGYYLASKVQNINGYWNYNMRRSNLSASGYYSRLSNASNNISGSETTTGYGAAYAYNVIRHVGVNARYDYIKYSTIGLLRVPADNRISFGIYFTSKDVPLSWH